MKNRINLFLILAIAIIVMSTIAAIFFFNKLNVGLNSISGSGDPEKLMALLASLKKAHTFALLIAIFVPLISISGLALAIWNISKHDSNLQTEQERVASSNTQIEELKTELKEIYAKLDNANKMAQRAAKFTNLIQKTDKLDELTSTIITELSKELNASQGAFFIRTKGKKESKNIDMIKLVSTYAYHIPESTEILFEIGEGLVGQVAKDGTTLSLEELPAGHLEIISGLGSSDQANLVIVPVKSDEKVLGIIEIASFQKFSSDDVTFIEQISQNISTKLSVLVA